MNPQSPYAAPPGPAQTPYGAQGFAPPQLSPPGFVPPGMQPQMPLQAPKKSRGGVIAFCIFGVLMVGAFAAGGVGAYLADKKTVQAKNDVVAIAKAAAASHERTGKLCGNALPVPPTVPKGKTEVPSSAPGEGFQRGSATEGWTCLGFSTTEPLRYQYEVRAGGNYKSVARGLPDPGPDAVEVSAEGDLDGDGKTGLIFQIGKVDKTTNKLVFPKQLTLSNAKE